MKRLISMLTSFVIWLALGGSAVAALAQAPGYANSAENNTFTIYLTALTFALGLGFIALYLGFIALYTFIFRNERNEKFSRNFIISTVTKGVSFPL
jgi:prepilin signal peptidase PulO-like enzyme (type II secretory pathway)